MPEPRPHHRASRPSTVKTNWVYLLVRGASWALWLADGPPIHDTSDANEWAAFLARKALMASLAWSTGRLRRADGDHKAR